jgi:hypothetical protein
MFSTLIQEGYFVKPRDQPWIQAPRGQAHVKQKLFDLGPPNSILKLVFSTLWRHLPSGKQFWIMRIVIKSVKLWNKVIRGQSEEGFFLFQCVHTDPHKCINLVSRVLWTHSSIAPCVSSLSFATRSYHNQEAHTKQFGEFSQPTSEGNWKSNQIR